MVSTPRRTNARKTNLSSALLALIVATAPPAAWANPITYVGDAFTLHVDNAGAIHRVPLAVDVAPPAGVVPAVTQAPSPATPAADPQQDARSADCTIPASAIAAGDVHESFRGDGRFSRVPRNFVTFYETSCERWRVPVRYLLAQGSYETHFTAKHGDGGRSCGVHQFFRGKKRDWRGWGFPTLADCMNPEKNIDRAAQHLRELMDGKVYPRLGKRTIHQALYHYNGSGAAATRYASKISAAAEKYYRS